MSTNCTLAATLVEALLGCSAAALGNVCVRAAVVAEEDGARVRTVAAAAEDCGARVRAVAAAAAAEDCGAHVRAAAAIGVEECGARNRAPVFGAAEGKASNCDAAGERAGSHVAVAATADRTRAAALVVGTGIRDRIVTAVVVDWESRLLLLVICSADVDRCGRDRIASAG